MARLAPISGILLKPRIDAASGSVQALSPALRLSLASRFEEPDLASESSDGWAGELAEAGGPTLDECIARGTALRGNRVSVLIARVERQGDVSCGIYCNYPTRLVKELADVPGTPNEGYRALLKRHRAHIDPLALAIPGLKPEVLAAMFDAGKELVAHRLMDGTSISLREVTDERELRALCKPFEPGIFASKPVPFILDGPLGEAKKAAEAGIEHIFACLIPVGEGVNRLIVNELLMERRGLMPSEGAGAASTAGDVHKGARSLPAPLAALLAAPLSAPQRIDLRRYHYSSEITRVSASEEWEEDLRIESRFGPCSALLLRGHDEFLLACGEERSAAIGIAPLYAAGGVFEDSRRVVLGRDDRAQQAFLMGRGDAVLWTPGGNSEGVTARVLACAPPISARRAMLGLSLPIPFGLVMAAKA